VAVVLVLLDQMVLLAHLDLLEMVDLVCK